MNWNEIVTTAQTATWNREFCNLIIRADEEASEDDKNEFTSWFEDQDWHDLHHIGIGSRSTPADYFVFADQLTWEELNDRD